MPLLIGTGGALLGAFILLHATSGAGSGAGAHGLDVQAFSVSRFAALALGSLGALDLYSGVLPFASLALVVVGMRRRAAWVSPSLRAVVLMAVVGGSALLLTSSAYLATVPAAASPPVPPDRYTFYVVPLLLVAFAAWIGGGAIREAGTAWVAAGAGALPIVAAFVAVSDSPRGTYNGFAFLPWVGLSGAAPLGLARTASCRLCLGSVFWIGGITIATVPGTLAVSRLIHVHRQSPHARCAPIHGKDAGAN